MTRTDYEAHAREWIEAWNSHDLERILSHYAGDAVLMSPFAEQLTAAGDGAVRGQAALREYFARALATYPDLRFELFRVYPGLSSCVVEYRSVKGLRAAETMEFGSDGKVVRVLAHYAR